MELWCLATYILFSINDIFQNVGTKFLGNAHQLWVGTVGEQICLPQLLYQYLRVVLEISIAFENIFSSSKEIGAKVFLLIVVPIWITTIFNIAFKEIGHHVDWFMYIYNMCSWKENGLPVTFFLSDIYE